MLIQDLYSGAYGEHDHKEEAGWPVVATDADYKHELDSLTRNNSSFNNTFTSKVVFTQQL